jgi:ribosomal protein S18 acetylase RimI-like enzyme
MCNAEQGKNIIGALICTLHKTKDIPVLVSRIYACIENITVIKEHRRKGIGEALINYAQQWAKTNKAVSIELTVWEFNKGARDFYQKLGYQTSRRRMVKDLI